MANDDETWKPSGRPTSMIAKDFSADLNHAFAMDSSLDGLVQSVQLRKEAVDSRTQELQAIEARLRDTEERLKERQSRDPSPAGWPKGTVIPNRSQPLGNTYSGQENKRPDHSATTPQERQAPGLQSVSASTMSRWKPTQVTASGTSGGYGDNATLAHSIGQENSRYPK